MADRGPRVRLVPEGDSRERLVCPDCSYVHYDNPRVVVGSVVTSPDGRFLMCRRSINPRSGFWTLPAGFLEMGESPSEGAAREAREEALARIEIRDVLAMYSLAHIGQVQIFHRASLIVPSDGAGFGVGEETAEVGLFAWEDIPWTELAFPTVSWALRHFDEARSTPTGAHVPCSNPAGETGDLSRWP